MFEFLDPLVAEVHTYTGALIFVFVFCTAMSASITQIVRDVERKGRHQSGRIKHMAWNHILRGVSALAGLLAAPVARRALVELPRASQGPELLSLDQVVPSYFICILVGFLTGFFLTFSIWFIKYLVAKWSPEVAEKIPDFGGTTAQVAISREDQAKLENIRPTLKPSFSDAEPDEKDKS